MSTRGQVQLHILFKSPSVWFRSFIAEKASYWFSSYWEEKISAMVKSSLWQSDLDQNIIPEQFFLAI